MEVRYIDINHQHHMYHEKKNKPDFLILVNSIFFGHDPASTIAGPGPRVVYLCD